MPPITLHDPSDNDAAAGFTILDDFQRFDQKNDVFRRSWWDARIRSDKSVLFYATYREPLRTFRKADGFTQKDYALRNAAWHVSDIFTELKEDQDRREGFSDEFSLYREVASVQQAMGTPAEAATEIKQVARLFGADLVGITGFDERWLYTQKFSDLRQESKPQEMPAGLDNVIVVAQSMDYDLIRTVPSALSGAATGLGYSHDAMVVLGIAQYIRNLGYNAVASMNDTALAIPLAIKAGLGEYGRNGLLITKEFGPRIRLGKIFTDLPLAHDAPKSFGVKAFCDLCRKCSDSCPPKAIPAGEPDGAFHNASNFVGIRKWNVDGEKCFKFWANQGTECGICIRVCPYNKDYRKWYHRLGQRLAGTSLRGFMLWLDGRLGYGERVEPERWWQGERERFRQRLRHFVSPPKKRRGRR
ncbi:MAG: reductive dehalogenase [Caldilineaceae bacterium]|nr:reductive dehalogenase [Caldilineaceae bacterium]